MLQASKFQQKLNEFHSEKYNSGAFQMRIYQKLCIWS